MLFNLRAGLAVISLNFSICELSQALKPSLVYIFHFTIYQNCQIAAYFQTETKDNQQQSILQNRGPVKFVTVVKDSEVEPKLSVSVILIKRAFPTEKKSYRGDKNTVT